MRRWSEVAHPLFRHANWVAVPRLSDRAGAARVIPLLGHAFLGSETSREEKIPLYGLRTETASYRQNRPGWSCPQYPAGSFGSGARRCEVALTGPRAAAECIAGPSTPAR